MAPPALVLERNGLSPSQIDSFSGQRVPDPCPLVSGSLALSQTRSSLAVFPAADDETRAWSARRLEDCSLGNRDHEHNLHKPHHLLFIDSHVML